MRQATFFFSCHARIGDNMGMYKAIIITITFITIAASASFADTERVPAAYNSPDQIRAEISRLRSEAIGKNGKPNPRVINDITKLENRLTEIKYKKNNRSNR